MGEMKEELKANEARLRAANDVMKADMEKMSAALAESSAKMSQLEGAGEEAKRTMLKNEATMRALHVIQKIMARPDAQDVFKRCAPRTRGPSSAFYSWNFLRRSVFQSNSRNFRFDVAGLTLITMGPSSATSWRKA